MINFLWTYSSSDDGWWFGSHGLEVRKTQRHYEKDGRVT